MVSNFLSQPYPLEQRQSRKLVVALAFGAFVFAFLYFFRPFGLYAIPQEELTIITIHFGIICSAALLFNFFVLPQFIPFLTDDLNWNVSKEISMTLWNILTIAAVNTIYSSFYLGTGFSGTKLLFYISSTLAIAILPVSIHVLIKNTILLKRNLKEAQNISEGMHHKKRLTATPDATLTLNSENKNEKFTIPAADLLYITAADNYIEIFYLENGTVKNKLIRSTLKSARDDLRAFTAFYRCHRGWIVNLDQVESITGNAQGYRLILNHTDITIPVSRNLNVEITNRLSK